MAEQTTTTHVDHMVLQFTPSGPGLEVHTVNTPPPFGGGFLLGSGLPQTKFTVSGNLAPSPLPRTTTVRMSFRASGNRMAAGFIDEHGKLTGIFYADWPGQVTSAAGKFLFDN